MTMTLTHFQRINEMSGSELEEALTRCCGSRQWVDAMIAARPFATPEALFEASDRIWCSLPQDAWLEAFSHHPKIGDVESLRSKFATTRDWASQEQSGAQDASEEMLTALAKNNQRYEARFGFIFIVCATGKTASEMLSLLTDRLENQPDTELKIAAGEQLKITRLRLEKWLS
jgi:2-oxo-4-hydroxy-4-carboxy-5-ureidoimidazoline decarboxylase